MVNSSNVMAIGLLAMHSLLAGYVPLSVIINVKVYCIRIGIPIYFRFMGYGQL